MTREEQIDWLCRLRADLNNGVIFTPWKKEFTEALNKTLEQESTFQKKAEIVISQLRTDRDRLQDAFDKIRAEIEKAVWEDSLYSFDGSEEVRLPCLDPDDVFEIIDKYKSESEEKK